MTHWWDWWRAHGSAPQIASAPWSPSMADESIKDSERQISPLATPVHIQSGSATIRIDNGVLIVEREGSPEFERPVELISAVHIHGWATITSPCVCMLISQGTPVIWRGPTGFPIGYAAPMQTAGLEARRAQYVAAATYQGVDIARALVAAKIINMRGVIRRRATLNGRECLSVLKILAKKARSAKTVEALFGIEGAATARYFAAWPEMVSERAHELTFGTRNRRPPRDEINALLSYAYAVLAGECLSACAAAGLDPRQGLFHRPRAGRPALALDLMEPFRPLIADQAILNGLNNGQQKPDHFRREGDAVFLTEGGKRTTIYLIEQRLLTRAEISGRTMSWRESIHHSARLLASGLAAGSKFIAVERG